MSRCRVAALVPPGLHYTGAAHFERNNGCCVVSSTDTGAPISCSVGLVENGASTRISSFPTPTPYRTVAPRNSRWRMAPARPRAPGRCRTACCGLNTRRAPSGAVAVAGMGNRPPLVKQLRAGKAHSVFVAAGDLIGASPLLSALFHDEPTIESLSAIGAGDHGGRQSRVGTRARTRSCACKTEAATRWRVVVPGGRSPVRNSDIWRRARSTAAPDGLSSQQLFQLQIKIVVSPATSFYY